MNTSSVRSRSIKWPLVPGVLLALLWSYSPRIVDALLILPSSFFLMPFPGQPREPEEIKFPPHSRSDWKKKTCIDSGSLDSGCLAAKDVEGWQSFSAQTHFSSSFPGETQDWYSKPKCCAPVAMAHFLPTGLSPLRHMPAYTICQAKPTLLCRPSC